MGSVAIKFVFGSETVEFYEAEVGLVTESADEYVIQHKNQTKASSLTSYSDQYFNFEVVIEDVFGNTREKIDKILTADCEMTFFPYFQYDPGKSFSVALLPEDIVKSYVFGEREVNGTVNFYLFESRKDALV